jgi:hypothetical protein
MGCIIYDTLMADCILNIERRLRRSIINTCCSYYHEQNSFTSRYENIFAYIRSQAWSLSFQPNYYNHVSAFNNYQSAKNKRKSVFHTKGNYSRFLWLLKKNNLPNHHCTRNLFNLSQWAQSVTWLNRRKTQIKKVERS